MEVGRIAGVPLCIHPSVGLLVLGLIGWAVYLLGWPGVAVGSILAVIMLASVLLHELGHALMARQFGVSTVHITLYPFGGAAALERDAHSAREEFLIAVAGPAVNLGLFVVGGLLFAVSGWRVALVFSAMNLMMALFNLLPAYPMDGGRMLRAGLATRVGWFRASQLSMQLGTWFGWAFVVGGVGLRSVTTIATGALLLFALRSEKKRVAWLWTYARDKAGYR